MFKNVLRNLRGCMPSEPPAAETLPTNSTITERLPATDHPAGDAPRCGDALGDELLDELKHISNQRMNSVRKAWKEMITGKATWDRKVGDAIRRLEKEGQHEQIVQLKSKLLAHQLVSHPDDFEAIWQTRYGEEKIMVFFIGKSSDKVPRKKPDWSGEPALSESINGSETDDDSEIEYLYNEDIHHESGSEPASESDYELSSDCDQSSSESSPKVSTNTPSGNPGSPVIVEHSKPKPMKVFQPRPSKKQPSKKRAKKKRSRSKRPKKKTGRRTDKISSSGNENTISANVDVACTICNSGEHEEVLLLCDQCNLGYHTYCVGLHQVPDDDFHCPKCSEIPAEVPTPRQRVEKTGNIYDTEGFTPKVSCAIGRGTRLVFRAKTGFAFCLDCPCDKVLIPTSSVESGSATHDVVPVVFYMRPPEVIEHLQTEHGIKNLSLGQIVQRFGTLVDETQLAYASISAHNKAVRKNHKQLTQEWETVMDCFKACGKQQRNIANRLATSKTIRASSLLDAGGGYDQYGFQPRSKDGEWIVFCTMPECPQGAMIWNPFERSKAIRHFQKHGLHLTEDQILDLFGLQIIQNIPRTRHKGTSTASIVNKSTPVKRVRSQSMSLVHPKRARSLPPNSKANL